MGGGLRRGKGWPVAAEEGRLKGVECVFSYRVKFHLGRHFSAAGADLRTRREISDPPTPRFQAMLRHNFH
jgi:hypothetical protein